MPKTEEVKINVVKEKKTYFVKICKTTVRGIHFRDI